LISGAVVKRQDTYHLPDRTFTLKEKDMATTFRSLCNIDQHTTFSSDTFRMYGLDRFIVDRAHGIGGFFAKLVANGLVVQVGWVRSCLPSNHGRMIRTYGWVNEGKRI